MAGYTAANNRRLAQLVRALGRHPRGQQFESATAYQKRMYELQDAAKKLGFKNFSLPYLIDIPC